MTARRRPRTHTEPKAKAAIYWAKRRRFAAAARICREHDLCDPAVATAVIGVVNLVDAVCVHFSGQRSSSDSHDDALDVLKDAGEIDIGVRDALVRHLTFLLRIKHTAQYASRLMTIQDADAALVHVERAYSAAEGLAKENG